MGLELVELQMAVEEEFGITIDDYETEFVSTPRNLANFVTQKLALGETSTNYESAAYHLLKDGIANKLSLKHSQITIKSSLKDLASPEEWRNIWPSLRKHAQVSAYVWPELLRAQWLSYSSVLAPLFISIWICYTDSILQLVFPALFMFLFTWLFCHIISKRWAKYFPEKISTIEDLIPIVKCSEKFDWGEEQIKMLIKQIIIDQLGIAETPFGWDADFIKDLGCG